VPRLGIHARVSQQPVGRTWLLVLVADEVAPGGGGGGRRRRRRQCSRQPCADDALEHLPTIHVRHGGFLRKGAAVGSCSSGFPGSKTAHVPSYFCRPSSATTALPPVAPHIASIWIRQNIERGSLTPGTAARYVQGELCTPEEQPMASLRAPTAPLFA